MVFGSNRKSTPNRYPCIVILQRTYDSEARDKNVVEAFTWQPGPPVETFAEVFRQNHFLLPQKSLKPDLWRIENPSKLLFLDRIRASGKPLREIVGSRVYRGITTGYNEAFVVDGATRKALVAADKSSAHLIKPYLRGKDVKRWRAWSESHWLIFTRRGIDITKYPAVYEHLKAFKKRLMPGVVDGRKPGSYEWFEIQDNIAYWEEFERPKIVSTKVSIRPTFALDTAGSYLGNTAYFFPVTSGGQFLLGLLNSNLFLAYARRVFVEKQGGWYEVQPDGLESFPIPSATPKQQVAIERIVSYLLWLSSQSNLADQKLSNPRDPLMSAYWEQVLNGLVYELYFQEDLYVHSLRLFDLVTAAALPDLDVLPERERLPRLRAEFERTYATEHPLRGALSTLRSLEIVRTIEGDP